MNQSPSEQEAALLLHGHQDLEIVTSETEGFTPEDQPGSSRSNFTAHEEALELEETHHLIAPKQNLRHSLRTDETRPVVNPDLKRKRRSLSLLVQHGSVHTLKLSPKRRKPPPLDFRMAGLPSTPVAANPNPPPLDYNLFTTKQTITQGLLLATLLMCNASQIKTLIVNGTQYHFFRFVTSFIIFSIFLEIILGIVLLYLGRDDLTDVYKQRRLDKLNNFAVMLSFVILVFNVFVATFGLVSA